MGKVISLPGRGAPTTAQAQQTHFDDDAHHAMKSALEMWANNGQINRVHEVQYFISTLLKNRIPDGSA